jgi:hypothetical protein
MDAPCTFHIRKVSPSILGCLLCSSQYAPPKLLHPWLCTSITLVLHLASVLPAVLIFYSFTKMNKQMWLMLACQFTTGSVTLRCEVLSGHLTSFCSIIILYNNSSHFCDNSDHGGGPLHHCPHPSKHTGMRWPLEGAHPTSLRHGTCHRRDDEPLDLERLKVLSWMPLRRRGKRENPESRLSLKPHE